MVEKEYLSNRGIDYALWQACEKAEKTKYISFMQKIYNAQTSYLFISKTNTGKLFLLHYIFRKIFEQNRKSLQKHTFYLLTDFALLRNNYNNDYAEFSKLVTVDYLGLRLKSLTEGEKRAVNALIIQRVSKSKITYMTTSYMDKQEFQQNTGLGGVVTKYFTQVVLKDAKVFDTSKKIYL